MRLWAGKRSGLVGHAVVGFHFSLLIVIVVCCCCLDVWCLDYCIEPSGCAHMHGFGSCAGMVVCRAAGEWAPRGWGLRVGIASRGFIQGRELCMQGLERVGFTRGSTAPLPAVFWQRADTHDVGREHCSKQKVVN